MDKLNCNVNNNYSFNFRKFRDLKKRIHKFMVEKYGQELISSFFSNKEFKEAFYKYILGFRGNTDVFNSGRKKSIEDFNIDSSTRKIIDEVKQYIMDTLYRG